MVAVARDIEHSIEGELPKLSQKLDPIAEFQLTRNPQVFETIQDEFAPLLRPFITKRLATSRHMPDPNRVDDVLQDVWVRVLEKIDAYEADRGQSRQWLYTIAYHICLDQHRRNKHQAINESATIDSKENSDDTPLHSKSAASLLHCATSREMDPAEALIAKETHGEHVRLLRKMHKAVGKDAFRAFRMNNLDELTNRDVGKIITKSDGTPTPEGTIKRRNFGTKQQWKTHFGHRYNQIEASAEPRTHREAATTSKFPSRSTSTTEGSKTSPTERNWNTPTSEAPARTSRITKPRST